MEGRAMVIGIGISTTRNREKTFKLSLKRFAHFCPKIQGVEYIFHIQQFYEKKHNSIAAVKNESLRHLALSKKCDYIFLFDDDCFPKRNDWFAPFIEGTMRTGEQHMMYLVPDERQWLPPKMRVQVRQIREDGLIEYINAYGCCLYMTRQCAMAVGAFDTWFGFYGFEHEQYSMRANILGQCTYPYLAPANIGEYIHSLDVNPSAYFKNALGNEYDPLKNRVVNSTTKEKRFKDEAKALAHWNDFINGKTEIFIPL